MCHALPNIDPGIHSRLHGTRDKTQRVVQQHLVLAHMHADRRYACEVTI
jgi:hypothetical protein